MKVRTAPGGLFPGDEVVYVDGVRLTLRRWAYVGRKIVQNDRRRKAEDPSCAHWKEDPLDYFIRFFREYVEAESDLAAAEVAARFRV